MAEVFEITSQRKGACLFVDYGDQRTFSNSLTGVISHRYATEEEILKNPGKVDLSAYVNFADLQKLAKLQQNSIWLVISFSLRS